MLLPGRMMTKVMKFEVMMKVKLFQSIEVG